jgi:uncharacterized protein
MSNTVTVRLPEDLADWLRENARRRGISQSQIIKDHLEKARNGEPSRAFMSLAGTIDGPKDLSHRKDKFHNWALAIAEDISEPLLTCEAVLAETAFHLQSVATSLAMIQTGLITLAFNCNEHLDQLAALAKRFADREPDLADLCLIRMSELHPRHSVVTIDQSDFRIYRRNKRDTIPLICPPATR